MNSTLKHTLTSNDTSHIATAERGDHLFLTAKTKDAASKEHIRILFEEIAEQLADCGAAPVHERFFGSESLLPFIEEARREAFSKANIEHRGPITSVDGAPPSGFGLSGVMLHCIKQRDGISSPEIVFANGAAVGRKWRTDGADFLLLQNIGADFHAGDAKAEQARRAFQRLNQTIVDAGFSFFEVTRTWFYLTDILSWYGDFNKVRSAAYKEFGIMPEPGRDLALPSSTGIGCKNTKGRALAADVLSVRTRDGGKPSRILNPAQKEAFTYGAAFSRAVEIKDTGTSLIEMSGTAAIDEQGKSKFPGDAASQIGCTLDKIEVLLGRVGATVRDIASATVFVKHPSIADIFAKAIEARGIEAFPAIVVEADVCRDELLFEMDAEALL